MRGSGLLAAAVGYALVAGGLFAGLRFCEPVRVSGSSMEPALRSGDVVIVRRGRPASRGDIVLVRSEGHGPVLHRVVGVAPDGSVVTKGDANWASDVGTSTPQAVSGSVSVVIPVGAVLERWRER